MTSALGSIQKKLHGQERIVIAGLGDSLTYGWMVQKGFFQRFCDGLVEVFPRAQIKTINHGVPGATAQEGLGRIEALTTMHPDLVVVQFGLNDCYQGASEEEFKKALTEITKRLLENDSKVILATSNLPLDTAFVQMIKPFYQGIQAVGRELAVDVARLDKIWQKADPAGMVQWDGVHPTDKGHELMAQGLLSMIVDSKKNQNRYTL